MLQTFTHYFLHFIAIGAIAYWYDKKNWKKNWLILLSTMLVDIDHVVAEPFFDPNRCGINYHPLHTYYAIGVYILGSIFVRHKVVRLVFIGLFFHMITDSVDCLFMKFG